MAAPPPIQPEPVLAEFGAPNINAAPPARPGVGAHAKVGIALLAVRDRVIGDVNQRLGDPLKIGDRTPIQTAMDDMGIKLIPTPGLHVGEFIRDEFGHAAAGIYCSTPVGIVDAGSSVGITLLTPVGEAIGEKIGERFYG